MNTSYPTYRRTPIVHEALADLDTPLSIYLKLAQGPYSYLLESAQGGDKWGRYSIIGLPAKTIVKVNARRVQIITDGQISEEVETDDPLTFIEAFQNRFEVSGIDDLPRFFGGLVGYFGYDTVRYVEKRLQPSIANDRLDTPDIVLMVSEEVVVVDGRRSLAARAVVVAQIVEVGERSEALPSTSDGAPPSPWWRIAMRNW